MLAWALAAAGCAALVRLAPPALGPWTSLGVGVVFLGLAVQLAGRHPGGLRAHGMDLGGLLEAPEDEARPSGVARTLRRAAPLGARELGVALALALLIFPPYGALYGAWNAPGAPFVLRLPPDPLDFLLGQLLVVALPEEAFFRGYLQTRLEARWPPRRRLLGAPVSLRALALQAALFAVVHLVVDGAPARLATFVPGLLFGWLRAWRGGIGAAVALHALSNLCAAVLARSFG